MDDKVQGPSRNVLATQCLRFMRGLRRTRAREFKHDPASTLLKVIVHVDQRQPSLLIYGPGAVSRLKNRVDIAGEAETRVCDSKTAPHFKRAAGTAPYEACPWRGCTFPSAVLASRQDTTNCKAGRLQLTAAAPPVSCRTVFFVAMRRPWRARAARRGGGAARTRVSVAEGAGALARLCRARKHTRLSVLATRRVPRAGSSYRTVRTHPCVHVGKGSHIIYIIRRCY